MAAGLASQAAVATPISGSDAITILSVGVAGNGTNLIGATSIFSQTGTGATSALGVNDLAGVPILTPVTLNTLYPNGVNGGNGGPELAFSFTIVGFGTFVETANPMLLNAIQIGNSQGVSYYLLGDFTPSFGGFTTGPSSFRVSFTESAQNDSISYSGSGTFASPPESIRVPEPGILALMGLGLGGLAFIRRRRDSKVK